MEIPLSATTSEELVTARRPARAKLTLVAVAAVACAVWATSFIRGLGLEDTDNAFVEGHVVAASSRVTGRAKKVLVSENQTVDVGTVLVELETEEAEAKEAAARAALAAAEAAAEAAGAQAAMAEHEAQALTTLARAASSHARWTIASRRLEAAQATAELATTTARAALARDELIRERELLDSGVVSTSDFETRRSASLVATATRERAEAQVAGANATVHVSEALLAEATGKAMSALSARDRVAATRADVQLALARVALARADLRLASINTGNMRILTAVRGVVSHIAVEPGQIVLPERPLMSIVETADVWVVANFKESQLQKMSIGQPADIVIDAYAHHPFRGHVESLGAASGSRFSLLPADNVSGNFVKVVQRVPIVLRIDDSDGFVLRPGLSASVGVRTGGQSERKP